VIKRRTKVLASGGVAAACLALWLACNPAHRFGWSVYALTTYSAVPLPAIDLQVRPDSTWRQVAKTHNLKLEAVQWLLDARPEVLVIATGWDGVTVPDPRIQALESCEVYILKNGEAIELYNRLKRAGRNVAIHYHSTC
jgi:hypothetical protein